MPYDHQRLIDIYRWRIRRCRSEEQVNRLHIGLEQILVPAELRHLRMALGDEPALSPSRKWIDRLVAFMPHNKTRPDEFERHAILAGMKQYTAAVGTPAQKTLILGFTGANHRLMAPTAFLLDCLNPAAYDMLLLEDDANSFYIKGVPGLGGDFFAMLDGLRVQVDLASYRKVIALGTSAGGLAAVMAAIALKLSKGISIAGLGYDTLEARLARRGRPIEPYRALIASRPVPYPDLLLVYAEGHRRDEIFAASVSNLIVGRVMKVLNCGEHGLIAYHVALRQLPEFLAVLLGQDLEIVEAGSDSTSA